jgi:glycosyltransferase involved in cell wall biosynthesis
LKISVVIPLYNKEMYIRRTIESVFRQITLPDEIIVVDDGSTDAGASVVRSISSSRIRLIHQQNAGSGAARNRGVAEAKNGLVAFLDHDDEWKPDYLTHILRLLHNFPDCGAYATSYSVIDYGGFIVNYPIIEIPPTPWIGIIPNLFKMMQVSNPFMPSSTVMPKKVYQDLGGFPVGVERGSDVMMWIRLGVRYPIAYSPSRQVIWHRDVEDRACVIIPSPKEETCARLIEDMLRNQEVPAGLIQDVKDYSAFIQISKAAELVKSGDMKLARSTLNTVRTNRKHPRLWLWWYFWSFMPHPLISFVRKMKSLIRDRSHKSAMKGI